MNSPLSEEERHELGLEGLEIGEGQPVLVTRPVAHGLVAEPEAEYEGFGDLARAPFQWRPIPELEELDFRLEINLDRPKLVKVIDETGAPISFRGTGAASTAFQADSLDISTIYLNLDPPGARAVLRDRKAGVLILPGDQSLTVYPVIGPKVHVEPFAEIRAPVRQWCADLQDPWLVGQLEEVAGFEDSWHQCVAAGMYARLPEPTDGKEAGRELNDLLSGRVVERMIRPRRWARSLRADERATLEDLALAEIDHLHTLLDHLEEEMTPQKAEWRDDLLELCRRRDDLAGILLLLAEANAGERLTSACAGFDRRAEIFAASIPARVRFRDEMLRRAWLGSPETWWASFFGDET